MTSLELYKCGIGDSGAREIAEYVRASKTLRTLNLGGNKIGAEGAAAIGDALRASRTLTELNLIGNKIGDEGAAAIGDALRANDALTELGLRANDDIGGDAKAALREIAKGRPSLTLEL